MLQSILRAAGRTVTACGNIGWPVTEAVLATEPEQDVLAVELSSFQLHSAPGLRPRAGVLLNLAEDHLDWYGLRPADPVDPAEPVRDPDLLARDRAAATAAAMAAYGSDKARALAGEVAVAVVDDPAAADLLSRSPAARRIGITAGVPGPGQLGVVDGVLVDRAFAPTTGESAELLTVAEVRPPGPHNVTNALAAAALAAAVGVPPEAIGRGLRDFTPGGHRNELVAVVRTAAGDIPFVDDSKATNPHAAAASLLARPRVVWIAGGQLKGASVDELVLAVADRLDGVVLLGVDGPVVAAALSRHAPDVPLVAVTDTDDGAMEKVVGAAARLARPGAAVVLAPAAASLDMYASYADRGRAFAAAVRRLGADGTAR
jgi:UDP-N-acetylmuramoylalanine--D-glutamate ligase